MGTPVPADDLPDNIVPAADLPSSPGISQDPREARVRDSTDDYPLLRAANAGIYRAAAGIAGAPVGLWNLAHEGLKAAARKVVGDDSADSIIDGLYGRESQQYTPEYFEKKFNAAGVPTQVPDPNSAAQRYTAAASGGMLGGVPGVVANVASQAAADSGLPPEAQAGVGLLASFTPAGAKSLTQRTLGINPATASENIARAEGVGASPTLGMAAGPGSNAQAIESVVSGAPGGAGIMARAINEANAAAGQTMEDVASNLSRGGVTDTTAGATLKSALGGNVPGKTNYLQDLRATVSKAFTQRDAAVPTGTTVDISKFLDRVKEISKDDPEFEQYIKTSPTFNRIQKNLADSGGGQWRQVQGGGHAAGRTMWENTQTGQVTFNPPPDVATSGTTIPYQDAAIAQRSLNQLVDKSYEYGNTTTVTNGSFKQAAIAMGQDVSAALDGAPGAKALDARAKAIWQQKEDAKEQLTGILRATTGPERMAALLDGSDKGGEVIDAAFRGLSVPQQNLVTGAVIQRLGRAVDSTQNAEGSVWSPNTFLTNWNKLHPDARAALFRNMPAEYQEQLSTFAKYAENVKASKAVYSNPSGTANRTAALLTAGAAAGGAAKGATLMLAHPALGAATVAAALTPIIASAGSAKLLTNPKVVRWLAASTKLPTSSIPVVAAQFARIGQQENDPEITNLASQLQQQANQ